MIKSYYQKHIDRTITQQPVSLVKEIFTWTFHGATNPRNRDEN